MYIWVILTEIQIFCDMISLMLRIVLLWSTGRHRWCELQDGELDAALEVFTIGATGCDEGGQVGQGFGSTLRRGYWAVCVWWGGDWLLGVIMFICEFLCAVHTGIEQVLWNGRNWRYGLLIITAAHAYCRDWGLEQLRAGHSIRGIHSVTCTIVFSDLWCWSDVGVDRFLWWC